jgi:hypothetical protein
MPSNLPGTSEFPPFAGEAISGQAMFTQLERRRVDKLCPCPSAVRKFGKPSVLSKLQAKTVLWEAWSIWSAGSRHHPIGPI